MDSEFWHQRWQENRIGFHQQEVNRWLRSCWLGAQPHEPVLVPLCGKSHDMLWLHEQGHPVDGVELSALAAEQFFSDNQLAVQVSEIGPYRCYQHHHLALYQGDFFAAKALGRRYRLVYDRAALIALPAKMRRQYAQLIAQLVEVDGTILLVTLEYQPVQQSQPPFSVSEPEVRALFAQNFEIELLGRVAEPDHPRVQTGELSAFDEVAYRLTRRG
ncbi:thiopurine S-methyltransferase [Aeromonas cavernicola]|uniref:Thiopurine S-methyltransferase n=1 Tax=Aeromonas cavernicola TaxID=1006623 RepID=A0A2H9U4Q2_9GAMM|nr:thiopurine S-methyltransferase [Aeromonas cavernicola]PJG58997.1 thiopurine S-methyltransferase [Aeromonas cavernicola]